MAEKKRPHRWEWQKEVLASDLSDGAKVVLSAINQFVNESSGKAWPAISTLMEATGKSERAVQRALREACKEKWLKDEERPGRTTVYSISAPKGVSLPAPLPDEGGVSIGTPGGVTNGTPGVSVLAPEPSIEPSILNHRKKADANMAIGEKKAESPETVSSTLPVADFKEMAMWPGWPVETAEIATIDVSNRTPDFTQSLVTDAMLKILGWQEGASRDVWQPVVASLEEIDAATMQALVTAYAARTLTNVDLIQALACHGIFPPILEGADENAA